MALKGCEEEAKEMWIFAHLHLAQITFHKQIQVSRPDSESLLFFKLKRAEIQTSPRFITLVFNTEDLKTGSGNVLCPVASSFSRPAWDRALPIRDPPRSALVYFRMESGTCALHLRWQIKCFTCALGRLIRQAGFSSASEWKKQPVSVWESMKQHV